MYRCQITGRTSRPTEKLNRVVVLTRPKSYTKFVKNEETRQMEEVFGGEGFQTVKEINCSAEGEQIWNAWSEEERNAFLKRLS